MNTTVEVADKVEVGQKRVFIFIEGVSINYLNKVNREIMMIVAKLEEGVFQAVFPGFADLNTEPSVVGIREMGEIVP